jgi:hypothetical protein
VLGNDPGMNLRKLIDSKDLPKSYGGELEWKFEDDPILDEPTTVILGEMPKGAFLFLDGKVVHA